MVMWSELRVGQYREDDHPVDKPHFNFERFSSFLLPVQHVLSVALNWPNQFVIRVFYLVRLIDHESFYFHFADFFLI